MNRKVIIIGGGAAGMMAAVFAANQQDNVYLYEQNQKLGKKLAITGKGRCNLTNHCDIRTVIANTPTNGKFMYSALTAFPPTEVMKFFEERGLKLKTERGNRVFPVSDKASDVIQILTKSLENPNIKIIHQKVKDIRIENQKIIGIITEDDQKKFCDKLIIATGGKSYPLTGSTGDGYRFAEKAGHTIIPLRPSLVPLTTEYHFGYDADGLLLKNIAIHIRDKKNNKIIYQDFGEIQLMRYGVTGAVILSASAHMREMVENRYQLEIDLKPALSEEKLDARLLREIASLKTGIYEDLLRTLMPKALTEDFIKLSGISKKKACSELTKNDRKIILNLLKKLTLSITGFRPVEEAIITSGGVSVKEIDPKTMESKIISGLYFAGEIIDADAYTGGFNLQLAFASGKAAALG